MTFLEILQEHGITMAPEGHRHTKPGWINFDCPWCGAGSRKWHMGYNIAFGYVNCWRCGSHNLLETLAELLSVEPRLCRKLLVGLERTRQAPEKVLHRGRLALPQGVVDLLGPHRRYLRRRGFRASLLRRLWSVQGIGSMSRQGLQWRLFIPIYLHNEMVSWTTRSISNKVQPPYRAAPIEQEALPAHDLLYGADYVRGTALVFEGVPDVWRIGPGAVATFGTQWMDTQLLKLSEFSRVRVCYDMQERTARRQAEKLVRKLRLLDVDADVLIVPRPYRDIEKSVARQLRKEWL